MRVTGLDEPARWRRRRPTARRSRSRRAGPTSSCALGRPAHARRRAGLRRRRRRGARQADRSAATTRRARGRRDRSPRRAGMGGRHRDRGVQPRRRHAAARSTTTTRACRASSPTRSAGSTRRCDATTARDRPTWPDSSTTPGPRSATPGSRPSSKPGWRWPTIPDCAPRSARSSPSSPTLVKPDSAATSILADRRAPRVYLMARETMLGLALGRATNGGQPARPRGGGPRSAPHPGRGT